MDHLHLSIHITEILFAFFQVAFVCLVIFFHSCFLSDVIILFFRATVVNSHIYKLCPGHICIYCIVYVLCTVHTYNTFIQPKDQRIAFTLSENRKSRPLQSKKRWIRDFISVCNTMLYIYLCVYPILLCALFGQLPGNNKITCEWLQSTVYFLYICDCNSRGSRMANQKHLALSLSLSLSNTVLLARTHVPYEWSMNKSTPVTYYMA